LFFGVSAFFLRLHNPHALIAEEEEAEEDSLGTVAQQVICVCRGSTNIAQQAQYKEKQTRSSVGRVYPVGSVFEPSERKSLTLQFVQYPIAR